MLAGRRLFLKQGDVLYGSGGLYTIAVVVLEHVYLCSRTFYLKEHRLNTLSWFWSVYGSAV